MYNGLLSMTKANRIIVPTCNNNNIIIIIMVRRMIHTYQSHLWVSTVTMIGPLGVTRSLPRCRLTLLVIRTKENMVNTDIASSSFNYSSIAIQYFIDYQDPGFILDRRSIAILKRS
jgi:hypothetical protein